MNIVLAHMSEHTSVHMSVLTHGYETNTYARRQKCKHIQARNTGFCIWNHLCRVLGPSLPKSEGPAVPYTTYHPMLCVSLLCHISHEFWLLSPKSHTVIIACCGLCQILVGHALVISVKVDLTSLSERVFQSGSD